MKYPEEMYFDSQIFAGDMDGSESNLTEKIVKIRASHLCCVCEKQVPKGERMLNQKSNSRRTRLAQLLYLPTMC